MEKQQGLKKIVCELNPEKGLPKHAMPVPEEDKVFDILNLYCYDSRREECNYSMIYRGRPYCSYKS